MKKYLNKKKIIISIIIAFLFSICQIIGRNADVYEMNIQNLMSIKVFGLFVLMFVASFIGIMIMYSLFEKRSECKENSKTKEKGKKAEYKIGKKESRIFFFMSFAILLLAYLPYYIRFCPGLLTADSISQVTQGLGLEELQNHHPLLNIAMISVFVNIGKAYGNINSGVNLYITFQMLVVISVFSCLLTYLFKKNTPKILIILTLIYYSLNPIFGLYTITMWKDILFSIFIIIFMVECYEMIKEPKVYLSKKLNIALFIVFSILMIYAKNNGLYIFVLTMIPLMCVLRKYWKKLIPMFLIVMCTYFVVNTILFNVIKIKKGSSREALSIPMQQMAKIIRDCDVDEESINEFDRFVKEDIDYIKTNYNPRLSDAVKNELDDEYFKDHKKEFIVLWLKMVKKHPLTAVQATILNSYGYYYVPAIGWKANRTMEPNELGIELIGSEKFEFINRYSSVIDSPNIIFKIIFSIALEFWIVILLIGYDIYKSNYKKILVYIPLLVLWLTCIASPVFCELRYAYALFMGVPILFNIIFIEKGEKERKA